MSEPVVLLNPGHAADPETDESRERDAASAGDSAEEAAAPRDQKAMASRALAVTVNIAGGLARRATGALAGAGAVIWDAARIYPRTALAGGLSVAILTTVLAVGPSRRTKMPPILAASAGGGAAGASAPGGTGPDRPNAPSDPAAANAATAGPIAPDKSDAGGELAAIKNSEGSTSDSAVLAAAADRRDQPAPAPAPAVSEPGAGLDMASALATAKDQGPAAPLGPAPDADAEAGKPTDVHPTTLLAMASPSPAPAEDLSQPPTLSDQPPPVPPATPAPTSDGAPPAPASAAGPKPSAAPGDLDPPLPAPTLEPAGDAKAPAAGEPPPGPKPAPTPVPIPDVSPARPTSNDARSGTDSANPTPAIGDAHGLDTPKPSTPAVAEAAAAGAGAGAGSALARSTAVGTAGGNDLAPAGPKPSTPGAGAELAPKPEPEPPAAPAAVTPPTPPATSAAPAPTPETSSGPPSGPTVTAAETPAAPSPPPPSQTQSPASIPAPTAPLAPAAVAPAGIALPIGAGASAVAATAQAAKDENDFVPLPGIGKITFGRDDEEPIDGPSPDLHPEPREHPSIKDVNFDPEPADARAGGAARAGGSGNGSARRAESPRVESNPHPVTRGQNFWTISRLYYSSGRYYRALWKANADKYPNIDGLHVGDVIMIPAVEDLDPAYIDPPGGSMRANRGTRKDDAADLAESATSIPGRATEGTSPGDIPVHRSSRADLDLDLPPTRSKGGRNPGGLTRAAATTADVDNDTDAAGTARATRLAARPRSAGFRSASASASGSQPESDDTPPPRGPRYKVRRYDTLRSIARDRLGDSHRDGEILELNRELIQDPSQLVVGQLLELPPDARTTSKRQPQ